MSYVREDWKYVAGLLDRGGEGYFNRGFHEQNLPEEKDLIREIERLKTDCDSNEYHVPLDEVIDSIKSINLDENQEYIDRLHNFSSECFEMFVDIKERINLLINAGNTNVDKQQKDALEEIIETMEGFFDTYLPLSYLIKHGPVTKITGKEASILNLIPTMLMKYDKPNSRWVGSLDNIQVVLEAETWKISAITDSADVSMRGFCSKLGTLALGNATKAIRIDTSVLEGLCKDYILPTKEEKEAILMVYPEYKDFYFIIDEIQKTKGISPV